VLKSCSCGSTSFLALGYPLTAMLEGATAGIALELFLLFNINLLVQFVGFVIFISLGAASDMPVVSFPAGGVSFRPIPKCCTVVRCCSPPYASGREKLFVLLSRTAYD
jgi:hypothetical protein